MLNLYFLRKGECIHTHLLNHSQKAITTRRRQVLLETNLLNKVKIGIENLLRRMPAEYSD